jgi:glycosyltransferase involved in cell wall biosynthesis
MRIAIASVQVPFISGGAELMTNQLQAALIDSGHKTELITMPFKFSPFNAVRECMDQWEDKDFNKFDCGKIDRVICLKFPSFYLRHPNKVVWLMHQHRSVYELFDTPYGESSQVHGATAFRSEVMERDSKALKSAKNIFTISKRVSERMGSYNGIQSEPIHQPPANAELFFCDEQLDYIFFPSRLERLKRQDLLIRAMAYCKSPVMAVIAGDGGMRQSLELLVEELNLQDRVRFVGRISDSEMRVWYANALGVFFGPHDEDYGFITLEAMLSSKPVITCSDSGGPLDFVVDGETGVVVNPDPQEIAHAIEDLFRNKERAKEIGSAGLARYRALNISWDSVLKKLLA